MQKPISWSKCGQVCYIDGKAWGVTEKLQRICLGDEQDIKKQLAEGNTALAIVAQRLSEALQGTTEGFDRLTNARLPKTREGRVR